MKSLYSLPIVPVLVALAAGAAHAQQAETKFAVPRYPNLRVVDYGSDLGGGFYRGHGPQLFSGPKGDTAVDSDGDGETDDDSVSGWKFSMDIPFSPKGDHYHEEAPSAVYYGGMLGHHSNNPGARMTEGCLNENHELRDDCNMMSMQGVASRKKGNFVQAWGLWFWKKEDFLHSGDEHPVTFDDRSMIAVHISRYWDDVDGGRWVVRDGDQFYVSEQTFGTTADIERRGRKTRLSWPLYPTRTRWAPYSPREPYDLRFAPETAPFAPREFKNVTAVGFYLFKDSLTNGVISVKWYAFECYARVARPEAASSVLEMVSVPAGKHDGEVVPAFHIGKTEASYAEWRRIYAWAVSNQFCTSLDQRGYVFDRDGDMGSMDSGGRHRASEPATDMTWLDAVAWCNALSEYEGRTPCYYEDAGMTKVLRKIRERNDPKGYDWKPVVHVNWDADGFRLPTPMEWASAAGDLVADQAWLASNSGNTTHPVGELPANEKGVHDAYGNVWEFVWDGEAGTLDAATHGTHAVYGAAFACTDSPNPGSYRNSRRGSSPAIGLRVVRGTGAPPLAGVEGRPVWTVVPSAGAPSPGPERSLVRDEDFARIEDGGYTRKDEAEVTVSDFYMLKTEVSFALWSAVVSWAEAHGYAFDHDGDMGSMDWRTVEFEHSPEEPVTDLGWFDARLFCNALSELQGRVPCYYLDEDRTEVFRTGVPWRIRMVAGRGYGRKDRTGQSLYTKWEADGYRLPTWAEWSIAWRAGDKSLHQWHSPAKLLDRDREGEWLALSSGGHTHPVGTRRPNSLGIYDLGGNVSEWLHDTPVDDYYRSDNPRGSERDGLFGIGLAGGHFRSSAQGVARRPNVNKKSAGWSWLGLRVVRCDAGVNTDKPFVPKVVLDVKGRDYDPLQGCTFRGNLRRTGYFGGKGLPRLRGEKWKFRTGGLVRSSPVVADGTVYIGSDDKHFYALDAATGTVRWKKDTGGPVAATATVTDSTVYVGSKSGYFYALDATTGEEKWRYVKDSKRPERFPISTSPAVAFGVVFFGVGRWHGHLSGLDATTGEEVWRLRRYTPNGGMLGPTIEGTRLYVPVNDITLLAVDIRTEIPVVSGHGNHCQASLAIENGIVYYNTGKSCILYSQQDLKTRLHHVYVKGGGLAFFPQSGPAVHDGHSYFAKGDHNLYAVHCRDGKAKTQWSWPTPALVRSSIAIAGDYVYFGCDDGHLYALERSKGKEAWKFKTGAPVVSSPCLADGVLYVGSDDGHVYALE